MGNTISNKISGGLMSNLYTIQCAEVVIDTYATGGIDVPFGKFTPQVVIGCEAVDGTNTYHPVFDIDSKKIKLFTANGTEVSAGAVTSTKFHVSFLGTLA